MRQWNRSVQYSSVTNGDLVLTHDGLGSANVEKHEQILATCHFALSFDFSILGSLSLRLTHDMTGFTPLYYGGIRDDGLLAIGASDEFRANFTVDRSLDTAS